MESSTGEGTSQQPKKKRKESKYHGKKNVEKYKPKGNKPKKPKKPKKKNDPHREIVKKKNVNVNEYKCYHPECDQKFTKWKIAREHLLAHGIKKPNIQKSRVVVDKKTITVIKKPPPPKDKTMKRVVKEYICYSPGCNTAYKKWKEARDHMCLEHGIRKANIKLSRVTEMLERSEIQRRHEEHTKSKKQIAKSNTNKLREILKAPITTSVGKPVGGSLLKAVLDGNNIGDKVLRRHSF